MYLGLSWSLVLLWYSFSSSSNCLLPCMVFLTQLLKDQYIQELCYYIERLLVQTASQNFAQVAK